MNFTKFFLFQETIDVLESIETASPVWQAHDGSHPWTAEEVVASLSKEDQKLIRRYKSKIEDAKKRNIPTSDEIMPQLVVNGNPNTEIFSWLNRIKEKNLAITQGREAKTMDSLPNRINANKEDLGELVEDKYQLGDVYSAMMNLYVMRHIQSNQPYNDTSKKGRMMLGKLVELEVMKGLNQAGYHITPASLDWDLKGVDGWINDPEVGGKLGVQIKFRSNNNYSILMEMAIANKDLFRWIDLSKQENQGSVGGKRHYFDKYLSSHKTQVKGKGDIPLTGKDLYHTSQVYACLAPFALSNGQGPVVRLRWTPVLEFVAESLMFNLLIQATNWKKQQIAKASEQKDLNSIDPGDFHAFDYFARDKRQPLNQEQRQIINGPFKYDLGEKGKDIGNARIAQDPFDPSFIKIIVNLAPDFNFDDDKLISAMGGGHPAIQHKEAYKKYNQDVTLPPITHGVESSLELLEEIHAQKIRTKFGDAKSAMRAMKAIQKQYPILFEEDPRTGNMIRKSRQELTNHFSNQFGANRQPFSPIK